MLDLLSRIGNAIAVSIQLVINIVSSLVNFVVNMPTYIQFMNTSLTVLPDIVLPFAVLSVTISVVLFLINRQGG